MTVNKAVLEESRDERGTCVRRVSLTPDGSLWIEGHDLGPMVERILGHSEYEFVRKVSAAGVDQLRNALGLGAGDDLIAVIGNQFQGEGGSNRLEKFIESQGIASEFWNRIGD